MNKAIQQLDSVIQQNASASEEMAGTAEELSGQAEQLQQTIAFFRIDAAAGASVRKTMISTSRPNPTGKSLPIPAKKVPVGGGKAKGRGLALDMEGKDSLDNDFERF